MSETKRDRADDLADHEHGIHAGLPVETYVKLGLKDEVLAEGWTEEELARWMKRPTDSALMALRASEQPE